MLPNAFARDSIPSNTNHIPTKKTTGSWPHLQSITPEIPEKQSCEVGLLIGCNCPQALAPLDVKRGVGNEPFAVKTELGWSVVGKTHCEEEQNHVTHQTSTRVISNDIITTRELTNHHTSVKIELAPSAANTISAVDIQEQAAEAQHDAALTGLQKKLSQLETRMDVAEIEIQTDPGEALSMTMSFMKMSPRMDFLTLTALKNEDDDDGDDHNESTTTEAITIKGNIEAKRRFRRDTNTTTMRTKQYTEHVKSRFRPTEPSNCRNRRECHLRSYPYKMPRPSSFYPSRQMNTPNIMQVYL